MANDPIIRFSVSLPEELLESLDRQIIDRGYVSRSEFIRDLIREQIIEDRWQGDEEVVGVLTIIYDHHQRELSQKMIDIQHDTLANILCSTHVHIDHHNCLETIIIQGKPDQIEKIAFELGGLKGIKFAKLTKTSSLA